MDGTQTFAGWNRGFSLAEALVGLGLLGLLTIGFLGSLGRLRDVVTTQGDVADASEDLRRVTENLVRRIRAAGAGGLPLIASDGRGGKVAPAIDLADNVLGNDDPVGVLGGGSWGFLGRRRPVEGTDMLRIRGIMTTPRYDISGTDFDRTGRCLIGSLSPWTGRAQSLVAPGSPEGRPFLFSLRSPAPGGGRDWRVVRVEEGAELSTIGGVRKLILPFDDGPASGFAELNGAGGTRVRSDDVVSGGFLDDFVYMVSENGFGGTSLYRLRILRGKTGRIVVEEIAPGIRDLQIAVGGDFDGDGRIDDAEWFLGRRHPEAPPEDLRGRISGIRLSVLARTSRPDRRHTERPSPMENGRRIGGQESRFRFRSLTVRVSPRSPGTETGDLFAGMTGKERTR